MADKLLFRRGLSTATETLDTHEPGFFTDTKVLAVGNGTNDPHRVLMERAQQVFSNKLNISQVPTSTGNSTTYLINVLPTAINYQRGLEITFEAHTTNTGPATLNVNGLGAVPLLKNGSPLIAGDLQNGTIIRVMHSGTGFVVITAGSLAYSNISTALPIKENGATIVASPTALNFTGDGVIVSADGGTATINIPGGSGAVPVQKDGTAVVNAPSAINFTGNVSVSNQGGVATVNVTGGATSALSAYEFTINFNSTGAPASLSNLPTGWTSSISGNEVTVIHNTGKTLKGIIYFGLNTVSSAKRWRTRYPTAANEVYYPEGQEGSRMVLTVNTSVVSADLDGQARVSVLF